jgi:DNA processing protein
MKKDELFYWLALWRTPGVGPVNFLAVVEHYADLKQYFEERPSIVIDWKSVEADLKWAEGPGRHIVTVRDDNYPLRLRQITSPPPLVFVEGNADLLAQPQIAMVGSRHPTPGGCDSAYQFAKTLVQNNWLITSGLALGIDAASHEGALAAKGKTIAVMGTGPDQIYPKRHQGLAGKIIDNGCLVTEFPTGIVPAPMNFPRRNRLISGLSHGVLVIEAAYASGSLVTAKYALEQNREVFAMPGSIHNPLARGCHALIKQGAKLVETAQDILEELTSIVSPLSPKLPKEAAKTLLNQAHTTTKEIPGLLSFIDYNATPVDLIIERSGISAEEVSAILLMLELEEHIQSIPGGYMRLK